MSRGNLQFQKIDNTGEIVGSGLGDYAVVLNGWLFSNSAAAVAEVDFYQGTAPAVGSGNKPTAPSASTTKIFTVQVPANASKEFFVGLDGIHHKYGVFAKTSASTLTGGVIWS
jgi:hypothetical protein